MRQTVLPATALELAVSREQGAPLEQVEPEPEGEAYREQVTLVGPVVVTVVDAVDVEVVALALLESVALAVLGVITWLVATAMPSARRTTRADASRMVLFIFAPF